MKKISIIIPAFNEEATIENLLLKVMKVDFGKWKSEIIVVDDGSTDKTSKVLSESKRKREKFKVIRHKKNRGKGAAIQTGLKHIKGDAVIVQDADLEYDPKEIKKLLKELEKGKTEIIFGARNVNVSKKDQFLYVWGINLSTFLLNIFYGSNITDLYTCYKLYRADLFQEYSAKKTGFEWDIEMITGLLKKGYKISEVPIKYKPRKFSEGKKIRPWDGIIGLWVIIKNRF
ncbi:glycosyltransferase family 2 protein [Candidatus Daviesbacteria bacterium]|nr:glycosyltransferase family 2 protein [Candidatus Daviesbacteria bacterium]